MGVPASCILKLGSVGPSGPGGKPACLERLSGGLSTRVRAQHREIDPPNVAAFRSVYTLMGEAPDGESERGGVAARNQANLVYGPANPIYSAIRP